MHSATDLSAVFFGILSLSFFSKVAEITDKYAHKDWVSPRQRTVEHGNEIERPYYVDVHEGTEGAWHCAKRIKFTVTPGFVLVFHGILMLQGARFGSKKRSPHKLWQASPYGLSIPYVWNAMTWNVYEFMRQHIHFAADSINIPSGSDGYNPLFKVS
jgi:hypothetical protein